MTDLVTCVLVGEYRRIAGNANGIPFLRIGMRRIRLWETPFSAVSRHECVLAWAGSCRSGFQGPGTFRRHVN